LSVWLTFFIFYHILTFSTIRGHRPRVSNNGWKL
jgi:hypothetical protein